MAYTFKQNLVSSSKYSVKCPYSLDVQYITVHDTANSATAKNEIAYMISNNNQTSFHIAVDETEAIQGLPLNRNAWACGDGGSGTGNRKSISVEICRPTNSNRSLYDQAEENAVYVLARLLYKYGLGIDRLKRHYDWSRKSCPNVIIREGRWESFKSRVNWVLEEIKKGNIESSLESGTTGLKSTSKPQTSSNTSSTNNVSSTSKLYRVVAGSFKDYNNAKILMDKVKKLGISAFIKSVNVNGVNYYRVYCGSYSNKNNAVAQQKLLATKSINSFISYE